jgi:hypothetical protein
MTDDGGGGPRSTETSNGGEPLSSQAFWRLVDEQRGGSIPPEPTSDVHEIVSDAPEHALSLEERLAVAQSQGLAPNLRRQLAFVGAGERVFELQVLGVRRYPQDSYDKSRASHARGPEEAIALCTGADEWIAHGIYLIPARLRAGVESRHAVPGHWYDIPKGGGTTDSDVEARLILAVDFDVKRPSAISATEEEMQCSVRVAQSAWSYLAHHLGESSLAYLHSGNGRQIHVALDAIPVTEESKVATAGLLTGLAHLFNTPEVAVDEKLSDAKRILPACGTVKKKGAPGVNERPHRRTAIVTPDNPTRVSLAKLVELARHIWEESSAEGRAAIEKAFGVKPQPTSVVTGMRSKPGSPFELANSVDPQAVAEWLGLYNARGEVVCPGCGETSGVAVLNHGLKCHHNRCKDRGIEGFRTNIDLVAEVRNVSPKEAVVEISNQFGLNLHFRTDPQPPQPAASVESHPSQQQVQAEPSTAPVPSPTTGPFAYQPRFVEISTKEIFKKLPPVNWLVQGLHIVAGRPTLIAGYGFSGKTLLAQSLAVAVASANPVWGQFATSKPAVVWHLDYEQGSYATKRRYQRLAFGHKVSEEALGDRLIASVFPDVYLDSPDAVDAYAKFVDKRVSVVVLDALRGATPTMDENDSTIRRCLDNLSRISEKTGTAFVVLHHAGKTRDGENSDPRKIPRGSSAIFDACGCVLAIEGSKDEPKLVVQTKAPAEAEGTALEDFYVSIEDVPGEEGPTTGLRVSYKEAEATRVLVAIEQDKSLRGRIRSAVLHGQMISKNLIVKAVGGNRKEVLELIRELMSNGEILEPDSVGGSYRLSMVPQEPPGTSLEPVVGTGSGSPGSLTGEPVPVKERERSPEPVDADAKRSQQAGEDASKLDGVDPKWWKSVAASEGWNTGRESRARAVAKARAQKAHADGQALHQVALQKEDPRAWATEQGWPDERIRAAMRFVKPASGGADPKGSDPVSQTAPEGFVVTHPTGSPGQEKARKRGKSDPAYADPSVLEIDATSLLDTIEDGMTVRQIETSPRNHWTPANVEVLIRHLVGDGRLVERDGAYFKKSD